MADITTGQHAQTTTTGCNTHPLSLTSSYALAKQVPDIADRGCTIATSYGDITIPPGRMAERLAELLTAEISRGALQ